MPPKNKVNKKTEVKKKEKLIEDKTFGMKNKKGRAEIFSEFHKILSKSEKLQW